MATTSKKSPLAVYLSSLSGSASSGAKSTAGQAQTSGNGGKAKDPINWNFYLALFASFAIVVASLASIWLPIARTSKDGVELQKVELATDQEKEKTKQLQAYAKISEASGVAVLPPGATMERPQQGQTAQPASPVPQQTQKETIFAKTFPCGTEEELVEGFARSPITDVSASQGLNVGPGCFLARFSGGIMEVTGKGYVMSVRRVDIDGVLNNPEDFDKTGDQPGLTPSQKASDPTKFVRRNVGRPVRFAIQPDGYARVKVISSF